MKNYIVFLKKELFEASRTYRLLIMLAVFLIFGIMSPLTAKMLPDIMKWAMGQDPSTAGMDLSSLLGEPTALDSWGQFYSNIGQMGIIALVVVASGMLSSELSKGTLTIVLTKGLSRRAVILSKLTAHALIWTLCLTLSFLVSWGYTAYLFPGEHVSNLALSIVCLWVFGLFLLALTALIAALTNKNYTCLLIVGAITLIGLSFINIIEKAQKYNPVSLSSFNVMLLAETKQPADVYPALIISVVCAVLLTAGAVVVFNKRKL